MLDWFSGYVGYEASHLRLGRVIEVDSEGSVVRERDRWETARGSFESGIQVSTGSPADGMLAASRAGGFLCANRILRMAGNPSKFLQGHNAAGPSVSLLGTVVQAVVRTFGEGLRPLDADSPILPAVHRSRVDITTSVDLGSHQLVHEWLEHAATLTRSRHGRAIDSQGTVYWGKHSTRWALKSYCKHCELAKHPPAAMNLFGDLLDWTRTHLRIELTLRRPELKVRDTLEESVIWEYFARVQIPNMKTRDYVSTNLRPNLRMALQHWFDGHDLKSTLPRRTFYKFRRELLDSTGIDVLLPRAAQDLSANRTLLGLDELRQREVRDVPDRIQRSLFGAQ